MKEIEKRRGEIEVRLREISDTLVKENRGANQEEKREIEALENEKLYLKELEENKREIASVQKKLDVLDLRAHAHAAEPKKDALKECCRALLKIGQNNLQFRLREEGAEPVTPVVNTMLTTDLSGKGLMPLTIGEIVKPLRESLIYQKVGIQLPTGCAGNYEWPVVEAITATIAGENVKVGAKKINLSKVATVTQRIAVGVEASREALLNSEGKLQGIIREQLPLAIAETVNQILISPTKVTTDCAITGPFVGMTPKAVDFTFKGLNAVKASLLQKNVSSARMCWVMTEATKAQLEATPKDAGSGIMVVENDKLCGLPIFCSEHIGEGNIGLGDFTYQVCGQFGDFYFVMDPYTGADSNQVKFWLNADFGTAKLRSEPFALVKEKTS